MEPANPSIIDRDIASKLYALGGGDGGTILTFSEHTTIANTLGNQCIDIDGTDRIIRRDDHIYFAGQSGGSGGGGSSGCRQGDCGIPSICYHRHGDVSEFRYNQQLKGGTGFAGQGYPGGNGDVDTAGGDWCAGGGGGAGGRGDDAFCALNPDDESTYTLNGYYLSGEKYTPPIIRGAGGGIGADLSEIVGIDLGDEGYFGGGGAAVNGIPGKGGGGCGYGGNRAITEPVYIPECFIPNNTNRIEAMPNTGGGGGSGYISPLGNETSFAGGSGVVIITFDACGCS